MGVTQFFRLTRFQVGEKFGSVKEIGGDRRDFERRSPARGRRVREPMSPQKTVMRFETAVNAKATHGNPPIESEGRRDPVL